MAKQLEHGYPRKASIKRVHVPGPPEFHEKGYLVTLDGACLEPVIYHGEVVAAEPVLPIPGEFACFFFKGKENGSIKRLVTPIHAFPVHPKSEVVLLIVTMQLNPPQHYRCLADTLDAIHRVRWVRRNDRWLALSELLSEHDKQHKAIPVLTLREIAQAF